MFVGSNDMLEPLPGTTDLCKFYLWVFVQVHALQVFFITSMRGIEPGLPALLFPQLRPGSVWTHRWMRFLLGLLMYSLDPTLLRKVLQFLGVYIFIPFFLNNELMKERLTLP